VFPTNIYRTALYGFVLISH